jgi:hypothetical protein
MRTVFFISMRSLLKADEMGMASNTNGGEEEFI